MSSGLGVCALWADFQTQRARGNYSRAWEKGELLLRQSNRDSLAGARIRILSRLELALLDIIEQWDVSERGTSVDFVKLQRARESLAYSFGQGVGSLDATAVDLTLSTFILWCDLVQWEKLRRFICGNKRDVFRYGIDVHADNAVSFQETVFGTEGDDDFSDHSWKRLHFLAVSLFSLCLDPAVASNENEVLNSLQVWWNCASRFFCDIWYDPKMAEVLTEGVSINSQPFDFAYYHVDPVLSDWVWELTASD